MNNAPRLQRKAIAMGVATAFDRTVNWPPHVCAAAIVLNSPTLHAVIAVSTANSPPQACPTILN